MAKNFKSTIATLVTLLLLVSESVESSHSSLEALNSDLNSDAILSTCHSISTTISSASNVYYPGELISLC